MKKDYTVLLIQLDGNLTSDVSTRCFGRPQGMKTGVSLAGQTHTWGLARETKLVSGLVKLLAVPKGVAVNYLAGNFCACV